MAKGKASKKEEGKKKAYPIVTSDICEICTCQCALGISYMERIQGGAWGKGVVCKKDG